MSDPTIAFQRQPLEILGRGGDEVTEDFIQTLAEWVRLHEDTDKGSHTHNRVHVLGTARSMYKVVVIARERRRHLHWLDVCAVDRGEVGDLINYFEPLAELEHLSAIMEVKLNKLRPMIITRVFESLEPAPLVPHSSLLKSFRWHGRAADFGPSLSLLHIIDSTPDRWVSSRARSHFKTLLEDARERPQVVQRDGDDLVVVSRRYLQETVDPTSAKGLSQRYLAMNLSDTDMPILQHGSLPGLDDLPELGTE
ncbi:hypothetical protein [Phenylobacterium sp.]|uniref:hypothetical protein n=1 Tax=Phenylobacterium sp. TaxID=1871053 RepID=UPI0035B26CF7